MLRLIGLNIITYIILRVKNKWIQYYEYYFMIKFLEKLEIVNVLTVQNHI